MVRLTGALSNHDVGACLQAALDRKRRVPRRSAQHRPDLRLPMGVIQTAALAALTEADRALTPRDVRASVEERLERSVSQDTVSSFLSVACRSARWPVRRVGRGLYRIVE